MVLHIKPIQDIGHHRYTYFGLNHSYTPITVFRRWRVAAVEWARWTRPSRSKLADYRACNRNWTGACLRCCLSSPLLLTMMYMRVS